MIVVLGDIAVDIVSMLHAPLIRGSDAAAKVRVMPGGSGANVAVWLSRLGQPVTFIGRVGDDMFGHWLAQDLAAEGVHLSLVVDGQRNTSVIQVFVEPGGERTMVPDRGANAFWSEDDVPEDVIASAELLHVVGYVLLDEDSRRGAIRAMSYARTHSVPISLDPSSHAPLLALGANDFWSLVGPITVLLPNRAEIRVLSGAESPEAALTALQDHAAVIAIKLDRDGCLAGTASAQWRVPAPTASIVNATGAGDAFNAAFLARWLSDRNIEAACQAGVALGTYAASLPGTR